MELKREISICVLATLIALNVGMGAVLCMYLVPPISREQQLSDLKYYADAFQRGEYDGHREWRVGYHRMKDHYVRAYSTNKGEWTLKVGDYSVIVGATIPDTSEEALIEAYRDGRGWTQWQVWSEDYMEEYTRSTYGTISKHSYVTGERDTWFASTNRYVDDDVEELTVEKLVDMSHDDWGGEPLYCKKNRQVAFMSENGLIIVSNNERGFSHEVTGVFPCLGCEPVRNDHAAYDDRTGLTFYVSEDGASVRSFDGTEIAHRDVCGRYDSATAYVNVAKPAMPTMYLGDGIVWKYDAQTMSIVPLTTDAR